MTPDYKADARTALDALPEPGAVAAELSELTPLSLFRGLEIHAFHGDDCPAALHTIGWLREQGFSAAGAGRGNAIDLDDRDNGPAAYQQLVAWDPEHWELVAMYRFKLGAEALATNLSTLRTYSLFEYSEWFQRGYLPYGIELGRSVVNRQAKRHALGFFATWVGLGALLNAYPLTKCFFGNVSLYDTLPVQGRNALVGYMEVVYAPAQAMLLARPEVKFKVENAITSKLEGVSGTAEGRVLQLRELLAPYNMAIPPVLQSYMSLGTGIWCGETVHDADFGGALELGIIVPVDAINERIRQRFIDSAS